MWTGISGSLPITVSDYCPLYLEIYIIMMSTAIEDNIWEADFMLSDNVTDFQLRWIQYGASEDPGWFIDEIYISCPVFTASMLFEEADRLENIC